MWLLLMYALRLLQKQDAAGKPVSLVTNDNPVWQAIRCAAMPLCAGATPRD
jgi:hypothetical protein